MECHDCSLHTTWTVQGGTLDLSTNECRRVDPGQGLLYQQSFCHPFSLPEGNKIHLQMTRYGSDSEMLLGNALVCVAPVAVGRCFLTGWLRDMEFTCCSLLTAWAGARGSPTIRTNAVQDVIADDMTFSSVLCASSCAESFHYFCSMSQDLPTEEHYNCMVDLLGWAGCLVEGEDLRSVYNFPLLQQEG